MNRIKKTFADYIALMVGSIIVCKWYESMIILLLSPVIIAILMLSENSLFCREDDLSTR